MLLYQEKGLESFLPYDPQIRPLAIHYLAVKSKMTAHERRKLAESMSLIKKDDVLYSDTHDFVLEYLMEAD